MNQEEPISKLLSLVFKVYLSSFSHLVRNSSPNNPIRIITLSATLPNSEDVAQWLHATHFAFDETYRPVPIDRFVVGFPNSNNRNPFLFEVVYHISTN